jgi:type VI secretion system VasD/TssJ family lipoprotein
MVRKQTLVQTLPVALIIFGLCVLSGCSRPIEMIIAGESDLNAGGNAVRIHIFQLTNDALFKSASVASFWNNPEQVLGDEIVGHDQVLLYPNDEERLTVEPREGTKFVGIAANLREPDPNQWRQIYTLDHVKRKTVRVSVGSNQVLVSLQ